VVGVLVDDDLCKQAGAGDALLDGAGVQGGADDARAAVGCPGGVLGAAVLVDLQRAGRVLQLLGDLVADVFHAGGVLVRLDHDDVARELVGDGLADRLFGIRLLLLGGLGFLLPGLLPGDPDGKAKVEFQLVGVGGLGGEALALAP
jgi:hypothetical protein